VGIRKIGLPGKGPGDESDGCFIALLLIGNDAEQVERFRIVGFELENLPVDALGGLQIACLVVANGKIQCCGNAHRLPVVGISRWSAFLP